MQHHHWKPVYRPYWKDTPDGLPRYEFPCQMMRKIEYLALMNVVQSAINNLVKCINIFALKLTADRGRSQKTPCSTKQREEEEEEEEEKEEKESVEIEYPNGFGDIPAMTSGP